MEKLEQKPTCTFRKKEDGSVIQDIMIEMPVTKESLEMEIQMYTEEMARAMEDYNRFVDERSKLQIVLDELLKFLKANK